ncbi:MAG: response regulator transcription factor [Cardiobacteriaceae bacterium]|nr:response regulator transcription factor [Cardiobacteriaceae bacterium]
MNILIIEDDKVAAQYIAKGLKETGHKPDLAFDGLSGLKRAREGNYDVLVIDRMLPKMDGLTIIKHLRIEKIKTPVLVLSALGEVDDKIAGLDAGGDDYLVKPYAFSELLARLNALVRRDNQSQQDMVLEVADLRLDRLKHTVTRAGKKINLQPKEVSILELLMQNEGRIVTTAMLTEQVWGYKFNTNSNVVGVHISRIRQKIDADFPLKLIHTIYNKGYIISAKQEDN